MIDTRQPGATSFSAGSLEQALRLRMAAATAVR